MNHLIEEQSQLEGLAPLFVALHEQTGQVSVDTEFLREKTFKAKLCLVQLGIGENQYCIDVLAIEDLSLLANLLADRQVLKLLHASRQDMEVLYQTFDVIPQPIFDTQLAAAFVGYDMQIGHTALVKDRAGIELPKSQARTDWTRRPLSDAQIAYAGDDVAYLEQLYKGLSDELERQGKMEWFNEEIAGYYAIDNYKIDPSTAYKRLAGGSLSHAQQYTLKALAEWREDLAHRRDIPRTWVLKDDQLFTLATRRPVTTEEVSQLDVFGKKAVHRLAPQVAKLISEVAVGDKLIWASVQPLDKKDKNICNVMMKELRKLAEQHAVAQGLLATRRDIESLYRQQQSNRLLQTWRADLVGHHLIELAEQQK